MGKRAGVGGGGKTRFKKKRSGFEREVIFL